MPEVEIKRSDFPKDFIFGAGTSAYQVEGAWNEGGKGRSNWDCFTLHTPGRILDGTSGCIAANHYKMFKDDVSLMKQVGLDAYRFSIAWSRILPGGKLCGGISEEGIKYYNDLIDALLAEGIEPWATIFHWDIPQCLQNEYGGFLNAQIVNDFCDFAEVCFWKFGDRVKRWITLNEPWTYTYMGYVTGFFPPGRGGEFESSAKPSKDGEKQRLVRTPQLAHRSPVVIHPPKDKLDPMVMNPPAELKDPEMLLKLQTRKAIAEAKYLDQKLLLQNDACYPEQNPGTEPYIVAHNLILSHAHAVKIYKTKYQEQQRGKIGITNVSTWFYPYRDTQEDHDAVSRALDFMLGWFLAPIIAGDYPATMRDNVRKRLPKFTPDEVTLVKGSYDFLGINYYTTYYAANKPRTSGSRPHHYNDDVHVEQKYARDGVPIGNQGGSEWLYIFPRGIYHLVVYIKEKYNNPEIYITENGVDREKKRITISEARIDSERINYHKEHLAYLKNAMENGACVKGYFIWSLLDSFEWAHGHRTRFGIFYVDYVNGCQTRFPKRSANWWMNFLKKPMISWNVLPYKPEILKKLLTEQTEEEQYISAKKQRVTT